MQCVRAGVMGGQGWGGLVGWYGMATQLSGLDDVLSLLVLRYHCEECGIYLLCVH